MKNLIWRNRANAILGLMVATLPFVEGFPGWLENIIFLCLGLLITLFAITGIKNKGDKGSSNNTHNIDKEKEATFMDETVTTDKNENYTSPPLYDAEEVEEVEEAVENNPINR